MRITTSSPRPFSSLVSRERIVPIPLESRREGEGGYFLFVSVVIRSSTFSSNPMIRKLMQLERLHGKSFARALRKEMTPAETLLWNALRGRKFQRLKFRRQVPIGKYVVDFLSMAHHLIVEVDGPIHEAQQEHDENRDAALREQGYRILRFSIEEVTYHLPAVLQRIEQTIFPSTKKHSGNGALL